MKSTLHFTQPDSTAYIILNQISNPLSEYSCKPQVWGAPREQLTPSGLVWWQPSLSESKSPWILLSYSLLPCDWLTSCHKVCDWMIFEIYISVSKLPLRWFYFCSNIMTDVAICKRNNFPKLHFQGTCRWILKSSWICLNRSNSLWQDWAWLVTDWINLAKVFLCKMQDS